MKLIPYRKLITMAKEKVEEAMAPIKALQMRKKAELKLAQLEEQEMTLQSKVQDCCQQKEIDYEQLIRLLDESDMVARRKRQYTEIIGQLFPEKE